MSAGAKSFLPWLVRLAEGIALIGSSVVAAEALGSRAPLDASLPWMVLVVVVLSWIAPGAEMKAVTLVAVPLLIGTSIAVADAPLRFLGYGLIVCGSVGFTAGALIVTRQLTRLRATWLATAAVASSLVVTPPGTMAPSLMILVGTAALGLVVFHDRGRNEVRLALVMIAGLTTPLLPWRAALFPFVVAAAVLVARKVTLRIALVALVIGALAGRWGLAMVLIPLAVQMGARKSLAGYARAVFPWPHWTLAPIQAVGRVILVDPGAIGEVVRGRGLTLLSFLAFLVVGLLTRPPLAMRFALAALVMVAAVVPSRENHARAAIPVTFASLALVLVAWSGVTSALFPLPVGIASVALVAAIASTPLLMRRSAFSGAVAAGLFVVGIGLAPALAKRGVTAESFPGGVVGAGEILVARPGDTARTVSIVAAGVNVADRGPDDVLGWIEILDRDGVGRRRAIRGRDVADWGAFRDPIAFLTRNSVPANPVGHVSGLGRGAFLRGSGRIDITTRRPIRGVSIEGAAELGHEGRLDVERIGFGE